MSAQWSIVGQIGNIKEKDSCYVVNIAYNAYAQDSESNEWKKEYTVWFNCISYFKPKAKKGDTVIAEGVFLPSNNPKFQFVMKIDHLGVIKDKNIDSIENATNKDV